jgi:hypothetical protein
MLLDFKLASKRKKEGKKKRKEGRKEERKKERKKGRKEGKTQYRRVKRGHKHTIKLPYSTCSQHPSI